MVPHDVSDLPHPAQIAAWRRMSPRERLRTVDASRRMASQVMMAAARQRHPGIGDEEAEAWVQKRLIRG
ncbi:MAG: hypothetical protein QGI75_01570 [Phycisphaerales bacterium]|nr:hypothetical protein [Phycisphaerales bacterium]